MQVIVLIKRMLFDSFQKISSYCGLPFVDPGIACGPPPPPPNVFDLLWSPLCWPWHCLCPLPQCIWLKFLKTFFDRSKLIVLMKGMLFDNFHKVSSKLGYFLNFKKMYCGPPYDTKFLLKTCFCQSIVIILMKGMLFDNFQKVWSRLGHFLNLKKIYYGPPLLLTLGLLLSSHPYSFDPHFYKHVLISWK